MLKPFFLEMWLRPSSFVARMRNANSYYSLLYFFFNFYCFPCVYCLQHHYYSWWYHNRSILSVLLLLFFKEVLLIYRRLSRNTSLLRLELIAFRFVAFLSELLINQGRVRLWKMVAMETAVVCLIISHFFSHTHKHTQCFSAGNRKLDELSTEEIRFIDICIIITRQQN